MNDVSPPILTRDEVRRIDSVAVSQLGFSGLVLMENAARGLSDVIHREFADSAPVVIVCGPGNNGGDGLALARQLSARGRSSEVLLLRAGKELTSDASSNLDILTASGLPVSTNVQADDLIQCLANTTSETLVVDCLLGTGTRGAVREPFQSVIEAMNSSNAQVLAADVPSGLDCDTGIAHGACVRADRTVTFAAYKKGFLNEDSRQWTGKVSVAHIGIPEPWIHTWLQSIRR